MVVYGFSNEIRRDFMRIDIEQRPEYFHFINTILDADFEPVKSKCISAVDDDGEIMAVIAFSNFTHWNCEISAAAVKSGWRTPEFVHTVFYYVFVTCGKIRATTIIREDNVKSIALQYKFGFTKEAVLKNLYGDKDGIVFRLLKEDCKYL